MFLPDCNNTKYENSRNVMFFQGDLQTGIAKAVQESKSVVVFVSDDGETSNLWEIQWLQDHNFPTSIEARCVALKLEAYSEQASFLSAFCPITTIPFLVVIYQGQVVEKLESSTTKNDFTLRLLRAINRLKEPNPASQTSSVSTAQQTAAALSTQALSSDRRARVEAQQAQQAARQKAEDDKVRERARIRREEAEASNSGASDPNQLPSQRSYAQEQVKRKREAQSDRERVLRQIQYDKQERMEREEQRRAAAAAAVAGHSSPEPSAADLDTPVIGTAAQSLQSQTRDKIFTPTTGRIQVRLMDGSTMRESFHSDSKLLAIREWIDRSRTDGDHPYTLKQLLTPSPSRSFTASDETSSIQEIGLLPSATLILVPVQGLAAAYQQSPTNAASTVISVIWGQIMSIGFAIVSMIKTFLGLGEQLPVGQREPPSSDASSSSRAADNRMSDTAGSAGIRIRTLRDQREEKDKEKQQLYNGNQLNTEPRKKSQDDEQESQS